MPNYNNSFGGYTYGMPYQPYMSQAQQSQPNLNNMYQQQQAQMNQYAFVNGIEGAKSFQLAPNQTMMLMDSDSPVCYMKSSNSMGQSTLRYFKLTEVTENDLRAQSTQQAAKSNVDYALKTDIDILSNRLDELAKKVEKTYRKDNKDSKER